MWETERYDLGKKEWKQKRGARVKLVIIFKKGLKHVIKIRLRGLRGLTKIKTVESNTLKAFLCYKM